ncbi:hypothetical protein AAFC00_002508 [Neodothiora populina]
MHLSDKKALRKQIGRVLSALPEHEVQSQSAKATDLLLSLPQYRNAKTISIFMSMPSGEINTERLLKHALAEGKRVFIPYIYKASKENVQDLPASIMDMLCLTSKEDRATLKPDKWGIPSIEKASVQDRLNSFGGKGLSNGEPPRHEAAGLDLIVMPSMAFDAQMNRLGHGKGYYDNFLTRYCSGKDAQGLQRMKPFLVGFALAEQLLPSPYRLPTESWDWKVDATIVGGVDSEARLIVP